MSNDYANAMRVRERARLEAVSLEVLKSIVVVNGAPVQDEANVKEAIDLAKEFIKQIDEEEL